MALFYAILIPPDFIVLISQIDLSAVLHTRFMKYIELAERQIALMGISLETDSYKVDCITENSPTTDISK